MQAKGAPWSIYDASQLPADGVLAYADLSEEKLDKDTAGDEIIEPPPSQIRST